MQVIIFRFLFEFNNVVSSVQLAAVACSRLRAAGGRGRGWGYIDILRAFLTESCNNRSILLYINATRGERFRVFWPFDRSTNDAPIRYAILTRA